MGPKVQKRQKVFVAYSGSNPDAAKAIFDGARAANTRPLSVIYEPWQFADNSGRPIISPIIESIDDSPFLVADITVLSLNVVYEVGYAIGRRKRVKLLRYSQHAEGNLEQIGIFDTLGYSEFTDSDDVTTILSGDIDDTPLTDATTIDKNAPIYIVQPPTISTADVVLVSRIKKAGFRFRSYNPAEDARMSAADAHRQVSRSSGVVVRLQEESIKDSHIHNVRAMFVLGMADAMGKPTLAVCSRAYVAPIDIRDQVKPFIDTNDIIRIVANFSPQVVNYLTNQEPPPLDQATLLASLSIGDPTAENEMTTLGKYYLDTDQFQRAINGHVNLVVGRKGSGKTAMFIRLRDRIRNDKSNIVVDLRPEGYQLIKLKEEVFSHLSDGAREHLVTAFWEYLILLEVAYKILEKDSQKFKYDHTITTLYVQLRDLYVASDLDSEGDFSERLASLSDKISTRYSNLGSKTDKRRPASKEITQLLHMHDIKALRSAISSYLDRKSSVFVMFDNLDKGWHTQGVDIVDAIVVRCLVDAGRKVEREMRQDGHKFNCIVFLRNDVYDNVIRVSPDYGKESRAVLDWTDPDLLREMLRLRLVAGLKESGIGLSFQEVWARLCVSHYLGEETSEYFIRRSLMRPRNLLKIFNHCRGFGANFNRLQINDIDIEKGLRSYSLDLFSEIDRELTDVFPDAKNILYELLDTASVIDRDEVLLRLMRSGINEAMANEIRNYLIYFGVLGVRISGVDYFIYDVNYDIKVIETRIRTFGSMEQYVLNAAFWPALNTFEIAEPVYEAPRLL